MHRSSTLSQDFSRFAWPAVSSTAKGLFPVWQQDRITIARALYVHMTRDIGAICSSIVPPFQTRTGATKFPKIGISGKRKPSYTSVCARSSLDESFRGSNHWNICPSLSLSLSLCIPFSLSHSLSLSLSLSISISISTSVSLYR